MKREAILEKVNPLVEGDVRHVRGSDGSKLIYGGSTVGLRPSRGARVVEVTPDGVKNVAHFVGLPTKLASQLSGQTFTQALTEMLQATGQYSLVIKDQRVINMVPYGAKANVNPERLLNAVEKAIHVRDYHRLTITPKSPVVSLEIVGEETKPVARGDLVRAGVKLSFSPMGLSTPMVQSYGVVLACTNGVTSDVVLAEFLHNGGGGGEGDDVYQFFRQSIRKAYGAFDEVVNEWRKLRAENIPPGHRAQLLDALLKKAQIPTETAKTLLAMAVENPPRNSWDMQNLITYASSHLLTEPVQIDRAQKAAASYASEEAHARTCPMCHRNS